MKILVTVKSVEDPEIKIKIKSDGVGIDTEQMKYVVNPFDEIAVEEALRLRDAHGGEVIIGCVGRENVTNQIRTALAMGADRAVHVIANDPLDPIITTQALLKVVEQESPDLVLLGKQAVDDDQGQVGIMLAEKLGWGQATCASKETSLESDEEKSKKVAIIFQDNRFEVKREVDGGMETVSVGTPALISVDLRLNVPRYASLPGIMKAKKKEIKTIALGDLVSDIEPRVVIQKLDPPPERKAGEIVPDVITLVEKLRNEAKAV